MIAMQYRFALPADYDMGIVDRRITEKGPLLDHLPNLKFKAYLTARANSGSLENLYAPFYVWNEDVGLSDFLCSEAFVGLTRSFGWPQVRTWIVWQTRLSEQVRQARFATSEIRTTAPHAALGELRRRETDEALEEVAGGALASVAAFEPTTWTRMRFRLWGELPAAIGDGVQAYAVGHLSLP